MKTLVAALAALTLAAGPAFADGFGRGPLEVSMGGFTPWDRDTRADDTSTWFRLGVNYRMGERRGLAQPSLYFDALAQSGRFLGTSGFSSVRRRRSMVGLGVGLNTTVPGALGGWRVDAGVGAGLYLMEIADDYDLGGFDGDTDFSDTLARGVNPGVKLRVALRSRSGLFFEASQLVIGSFRGLRYDGSSLSVGFRF